ncbi:soluble quino protein glucose dehydrogenase [Pleomassaria siparia CBS 279.74]|uniref:Soluble quino protein glucose dehydrogenase n=1 Tax=Pleomassaria siparia CBS 279.74 TaxID=1314801 RepID=A0A6G1JVG3_9PLEO|nr:soluble quino protein glucose dehydrogenase [Pleomassaria siparia CBS 279.74]
MAWSQTINLLAITAWYIVSNRECRVNAQGSSAIATTATTTITTTTAATVSATACSSTIAPRYTPLVASGYSVQVVASGLSAPRGIIFDSEGHLLVVQQGYGISSLNLTDDGGACVRAGEPTDVIRDDAFNHGIELSSDGKTLYASSPAAVYSWDYDVSTTRNSSGPHELIGQMGDADGHVTRTLLLSRQVPGMLIVSRGSLSNLDPSALDISTGVSTIKAFNISNVTSTPYIFAQDGLLLGWGLRNSVGVGEDPATGAIYSVENSVDDFTRQGQNIHQNNPGEEMNFHGYLNGTTVPEQGGNYGYPSCYAAWDVSSIPDNDGNIQLGTQFAIGDLNSTLNDTFCRENHVAPRLTFPAHTAPLDIKFNSNGSAAWVTFHGSWDRDDPIGYKLSVIPFSSNSSSSGPTAASTSNSSTVDILTNPDLSKCPDQCVRPVGLAWDSQGRLFMSSDATGEIFVVVRNDGGSVNDASPTTGLPPTSTGAAPARSSTAAAVRHFVPGKEKFAALVAFFMALPLA